MQARSVEVWHLLHTESLDAYTSPVYNIFYSPGRDHAHRRIAISSRFKGEHRADNFMHQIVAVSSQELDPNGPLVLETLEQRCYASRSCQVQWRTLEYTARWYVATAGRNYCTSQASLLCRSYSSRKAKISTRWCARSDSEGERQLGTFPKYRAETPIWE